jgi:hypothetical protein
MWKGRDLPVLFIRNVITDTVVLSILYGLLAALEYWIHFLSALTLVSESLPAINALLQISHVSIIAWFVLIACFQTYDIILTCVRKRR